MHNRISTGIKGLDTMLEGGLIRGSCVMLLGPPGTGKSTLCLELIYQMSKQGNDVLMISTKTDPKQIHEELQEKGKNNILVLDGRPGSNKKTNPDNKCPISNLNDFKIKLGSYLKEDMIVIIDSMSDLLLHNDPVVVYKCTQLMRGTIKEKNALLIMCLEENIHAPTIENTIKYITDGTIELKLEETQRKLRIMRMNNTHHPLVWVPFNITDKGVNVNLETGLICLDKNDGDTA